MNAKHKEEPPISHWGGLGEAAWRNDGHTMEPTQFPLEG